MKAVILACVLFLCAATAQSQSVFLEYANPFNDGTALIGPAQIELNLFIDFPPGGNPSLGGAVNVLYNDQLTDLNNVIPQLPPCPAMGAGPCLIPGNDDDAGTIFGIGIEAAPGTFLQGFHQVATLVFDADSVGIAAFSVEQGSPDFGVPVNFNTVSVSIVLPSCESGSLPENFHQADATGLPANWVSVFPASGVDSDGDGINDSADNCQLVANPSQCDTDSDGYGNHCDADLNNDCSSNFADLEIMKQNFFSPGNSVSDLNCDNFTNFSDLSIMQAQFFLPPGPSGTTNTCSGPQAKSGVGGWKTTAGDFCDFTGDFIGDNVTGGLAQAACLEPPVPTTGAALCTQTPLNIANAINPLLELHANFQPKGPGTFAVKAGTAPPTPAAVAAYNTLYETDQALGAFRSLPGETLIINLPSVAPLYVCVVVDGFFDYAQVDHCIACALSCGGLPDSTPGPTRNPDCGVERF